MPNIMNSDIVRKVLKSILVVAGRRTLDSYALRVLKSVINILQREFDFLKYIEIKDDDLSSNEIITISSNIDTIKPKKIGKAIDVILRQVYIELKDGGGLYFINEFKDCLGDDYVKAVEEIGVDLDDIQSEQHKLFIKKDRKKPIPPWDKKTIPEKDGIDHTHILDYGWTDVSRWKYNNNVVFVYGHKNNLLDKLQLDVLVEDYVNNHSKYKEIESVSKKFEVDEKELEFLQMLHSRDMDIDLAKVLLHISQDKLDSMIKKLLEFEMLKRISFNELKLTDKGIKFLLEIK